MPKPEHVSHRPANLKQQNKTHKGFSKHSLENKLGRISKVKTIPVKRTKKLDNKIARYDHARQIRKNKQDKIIENTRIGKNSSSPRIIAIIPISCTEKQNEELFNKIIKDSKILDEYRSGIDKTTNNLPYVHSYTFSIEKHEYNITFQTPPKDPILVADSIKVADIVLLHMIPDINDTEGAGVDDLGNHLIQIIKSQGYPNIIGITQQEQDIIYNKKNLSLKLVQRFFTTVFDDIRIFNINTINDTNQLLRHQVHIKLVDINWRTDRTYLLGLTIDAEKNPSDSIDTLKDPQLYTLQITGYLRGKHTLNSNQLIHLVGYGDYSIIMIEGRLEDPIIKHDTIHKKVWRTISISDTNRQRLSYFADDDSTSDNNNKIRQFRTWNDTDIHYIPSYSQNMIPNPEAGSIKLGEDANTIDDTTYDSSIDYTNSVWDDISSISDDDNYIDTNSTMGDTDDVDADDHKDCSLTDDPTSMNDTLQTNTIPIQEKGIFVDKRETYFINKPPKDKNDNTIFCGSIFERKSRGGIIESSKKTGLSVIPYKEKVQELLQKGIDGEEELLLLKKELEKKNNEWIDEPDIYTTISMRDRFLRYRSLRSFKRTIWNPIENLPLEYSKVSQFSNIIISEKNAKDLNNLKRYDNILNDNLTIEQIYGRHILPDTFTPIRIYISNVSENIIQDYIQGKSIPMAWGLYNHEEKISLAHTLIKRCEDGQDQPIKSKQPIHIQIGFRRITVSPIYSKIITNTDKTLMLRWLPKDKWVIASFYTQILYPPANVLIFSASILGTQKYDITFNPLLATGKLLTFNPSKLIIKRSVITGHPVEIHGYKAVIKNMFFNPQDVQWFKPVELYTKQSNHGRIDDSRGTHGLFKGYFSKKVQSNDIVCMALYKRQFPIWNTSYM